MAIAVSASRARPKRKPGERTRLLRLSPEIRHKLLEEIRAGVPITMAAQAASIPQRTFMDWLAKGRLEDAEEVYRSFLLEVEEAREYWAAQAVKRIDAAGDKDHRALAWLLERQRPEEFGPPVQRQDVQVQARPFIDLSRLPLERQALLLELLREATPPREELPVDARPALELLGGEVVEGEAVEA